MEDRLSAEEELETSLSLEDELAELGLDTEVEDELASLKARLSESGA